MINTYRSLAISLAAGCLIGTATAVYYNKSADNTEASLRDEDTSDPIAANSSSTRDPLDTVSHENRSGNDIFDTRVETAYAYESRRRSDWEIERLFENMTLEEAPEMLAKILANPDYHKPGGLLGPFFGRWAELDGAAAFAASAKLEGRFASDAEKFLFPAWARSDVQAAWEASQAQLNLPRPRFNGWLRDVIEEMAKQDPNTLVQFAKNSSNEQSNQYISSRAIATLSASGDYENFNAAIQTIDKEGIRQQWTRDLFRNWARQNTDRALAEVGNLTDPLVATAAMEGLLTGWAANDRQAALDHLFANPNDASVKNATGAMIQTALQNGSASENSSLLKRLNESGMISAVAFEIGSPSLARSQPEIALQAADYLGSTREAEAIRQNTLRIWAQQDFDKAFDYYDQSLSTDSKANVVPKMALAIMRQTNSGPKLERLVKSLPQGKERTAIVEQLLITTTRMGPRLGNDFAEALMTIAESETELSEEAKIARDKLSGPAETTTIKPGNHP